jgi:hypothetical protein
MDQLFEELFLYYQGATLHIHKQYFTAYPRFVELFRILVIINYTALFTSIYIENPNPVRYPALIVYCFMRIVYDILMLYRRYMQVKIYKELELNNHPSTFIVSYIKINHNFIHILQIALPVANAAISLYEFALISLLVSSIINRYEYIMILGTAIRFGSMVVYYLGRILNKYILISLGLRWSSFLRILF